MLWAAGISVYSFCSSCRYGGWSKYLFGVAEIEYSRDVALRKVVALTVILIPWLMALGTLLPS